jgi:hypothetical protein
MGVILVNIVDLTLRDAHQSLIATRLKTDDMIPILDKIDGAGVLRDRDVGRRYIRRSDKVSERGSMKETEAHQGES